MILAARLAAGQDIALVFIELGAAITGLALLARLANRWGFSAIPLFLLAGLAFGNGGLLPLDFSADFVHIGAEIGVVLLMFMLGLEHTGKDLMASLQKGLAGGLVDLALNFAPGLIAGFLLGWSWLPALLLGGVTYISSSGLVGKVLLETGWKNSPVSSVILSILILEDLAMAAFLPVVGALLLGQDMATALIAIFIALAAAGIVLFVAVNYGPRLSLLLAHESNEIVLLTAFGLVLLVSGLAQQLQVSAAVGAFLVGIAFSGQIAHKTYQVFAPLRDLFTAVFFFFFGLQIDPSTLPPIIHLAALLGIVSALTKLATGWWAARRAGFDAASRLRAGVALVSRGEFSIVIAGLGVAAGIEPQLGPLSAAYVLLMAIAGPLLAQLAKRSPSNASG